jgi:hypothetical protein
MPVMNIVDYRDEPHNTSANIVVEPSFQDNSVAGATQHRPVRLDWIVKELGTMTIGEAISLMQADPAGVTLYLYNPGPPQTTRLVTLTPAIAEELLSRAERTR